LKNIIEAIKVIVGEIKKDIDVYVALQKYSRNYRKADRAA